jgi:mono/diheme cytochrome c family protein
MESALPAHLAFKRRLICRAFILWMAALIAGAQMGCSKNEREPSANNPATAESAAASPALIERGRYLAFAGNCGACHTTAGGAPFAGGLAFETPFGKVYSANITPDPDTGIGGWTSGQFLQSLRKGLRANDQHLYPVFPYPALTKITDEDAAALFAFLKSVPAVRYDVPKNEMSWPFGQRWLLGAWNAMFFDEGPYRPDTGKSAEWNRGAYLVTGPAHCSACHSPRNLLGAERAAKAMTGGTYRDDSAGGVMRPWSAPNLTSASSGLGSWSVEEIAAYLKAGTNSYTTTFGPMNTVILKSTMHLSDADLRAMAVYLKGLPPNEGDFGAPAKSDVLQAGETLYNVNCGTCHQPDGMGADDAGPRLAGSLVTQATDPASLVNSILYGVDVPNPAPGGHQWRPMEAYGDKLSDEEVAALASYLRSAWNNKGGEVTAKQVSRQR